MPAAIPLIIALTATEATIQVVGQVKAGNAAKKAGDIQAQIGTEAKGLDDYNAAAAEAQAQDAVARGAQDEQRFRLGVKGIIGTQRAGFAGQGVDVNSGSAVDVQADAAFLGELDALTIRTNAAREAWGYQVQAENDTRKGVIDQQTGQYAQQAGNNAQTASRYQAAGTILGSTTSLLAAKYGFGKAA